MNVTTKSTETSPPTPIARPKGIWVVTIWLGLFAGLLPVALALFIFFGPARDQGIMSPSGLAISLALGLTIIGSSIAAWRGHGWARYVLIALAVVHYGLLAWNNFNLATSGIAPEGKIPMFWARVVRSVVMLSVVVLYLLLSRRAREFFTYYRRVA